MIHMPMSVSYLKVMIHHPSLTSLLSSRCLCRCSCLHVQSASPLQPNVRQVGHQLDRGVNNSMLQKRTYFYEPTRKGHPKYDFKNRQLAEIKFETTMYYGAKIFWQELIKWIKTWKDFWMQSERPHYDDNQEVVIWKFDNQETIDQWVVSKDGDWGEGYSTATFERSPAGHAIFHGFLDTKSFPKDPTISRVGWTFVSSPPKLKSFLREGCYEWHQFTHMIFRVRGDGRTYNISMRTPGNFDILLFDVYSFGLYTHGGPYWQYVRIPFSRFIFTNKGAVQDFQEVIDLTAIRSFGIGCMDKIHGPFRLEIDYIALENDESWNENTQYEMYYVPQAKYNEA